MPFAFVHCRGHRGAFACGYADRDSDKHSPDSDADRDRHLFGQRHSYCHTYDSAVDAYPEPDSNANLEPDPGARQAGSRAVASAA